MAYMKQIFTSFLAVVLSTSWAFGSTLTASDTSYLPTLQKLSESSYRLKQQSAAIDVDVTDPKIVLERIREAMDLLNKSQLKRPSKMLGAAQHTLKQYPMESLYFFLGMGAVAFGQLVFDNSQNPVGLQQHIEHSLSPMGMAGFAVFMYFNNFDFNIAHDDDEQPSFYEVCALLGNDSRFLGAKHFLSRSG